MPAILLVNIKESVFGGTKGSNNSGEFWSSWRKAEGLELLVFLRDQLLQEGIFWRESWIFFKVVEGRMLLYSLKRCRKVEALQRGFRERASRVPAEASSCREEPHAKGRKVYVGGRREGGFVIPAEGLEGDRSWRYLVLEKQCHFAYRIFDKNWPWNTMSPIKVNIEQFCS